MLDGEMERLDRVKTSVEDAKQIKARFLPIMAKLAEVREYVESGGRSSETSGSVQISGTFFPCRWLTPPVSFCGFVGCPHCHYTDKKTCVGCAWDEYDAGEKNIEDVAHERCIFASFNGIDWIDVRRGQWLSLLLKPSTEEISISIYLGDHILNEEIMGVTRLELERCEKFGRGHIEWADSVIARDVF